MKLSILKDCIVLMLFLLSFIAVNINPAVTVSEFPSNKPVLFVDPSIAHGEVGDNFTITMKIFNVSDLYGLDIQFGWDPTVIKYVSHTKHIPIDGTPPYSDGVLYKPTLPVKDIVDETGELVAQGAVKGTLYWLVEASMSPANPTTNAGNSTVFEMTFQVLQLKESQLKIYSSVLSNKQGRMISHQTQDGVFRPLGLPVASFTFEPTIAIVDKPVYFNASVTGNFSDIDKYVWDFGDETKVNTTVPETFHSYSSPSDYVVSLKVVALDGKESSIVTKTVKVVKSRDLAVLSISDLHWAVHQNLTLPFTAIITNLGYMTEYSSTIAYYNTSIIDWANPTDATWIQFERQNNSIVANQSLILDFTFNASAVPLYEAYYYILLNVTGIPYEYEANVTNNVLVSRTPILVTQQIIYDVIVESFDCGYEYRRFFYHPCISGEDVTFETTVKNNGTYSNTINVTLYINSQYKYNWITSVLTPSEVSIPLRWHSEFSTGVYNITIEAKIDDAVGSYESQLFVVAPPTILVDYSPTEPVVNQTLTLNASASHHNDPAGNITVYTWAIYAPEDDGTAIEDPSRSPVFKSFTGSESAVNFVPTRTGNWTVLLGVTDNFGLKGVSWRDKTSSWGTTFNIVVGTGEPEEGGAFPIEYIVAIIVIVVVVVLVAFLMYKRRKSPKTR